MQHYVLEHSGKAPRNEARLYWLSSTAQMRRLDMYCKCGCPDEMILHKVQRNLKIVAIWLKCACCGLNRVEVCLLRSDSLEEKCN